MTLGASWLLVLISAGEAPPCHRELAISGDEELAVRLRDALQDRSVLDDESCGKEVSIEKEDEQIVLSLRDEERITVRRMTSMASSAVAVESWLRDDLAAPLLSPRALPIPKRAPFHPELDEGARPTAVEAEKRNGLDLALNANFTYASDNSLWAGLTADGCYPIDFVCAGLVARFGADLGLGLEEDVKRLMLDFAALGEVPFELGPVHLRPALELGVVLLRTVRYVGNDDADATTWGFRAGVRLGIRVPLSEAFGLGFSLNTALVPLAHTETQYDEGVPLPGEPRFYIGLGVGIEGTTK